ncbi:MAG: hypothetical protein ABJF67_17130 [Aurantimonas coralicida]|uniref:hypothetical protein n=1 Tax=Nisaea sp. TaxID=2024842 RepID=UPI003265016C
MIGFKKTVNGIHTLLTNILTYSENRSGLRAPSRSQDNDGCTAEVERALVDSAAVRQLSGEIIGRRSPLPNSMRQRRRRPR